MTAQTAAVVAGERLAELRGRTLWQALQDTTARAPQHEALVAWDDARDETRLTYGELAARARLLSEALVAAGVRRGDRVALLMTNRIEFVVTYFAVTRIGAALVPVNTRLAGPEIAYVIRHARARHLITLDRFRSVDFLAVLDEAAAGWREATPGSLCCEGLPELRTIAVLTREAADGPTDGALDLRELMAGTSSDRARALADELTTATRPDDIALIKYTSGSTGFPKGAMLEHGGLIADALLHTERLEIGAEDRWCGNPPLFHVGGSVWGLLSCVTRGATLVFSETFDPDVALDLVEREHCTVLFGVPTMLRDMLARARQRRVDLSSVTAMGGGLDAALAAAMREAIPGLRTTINGFGLTEGYGTSACPGPTMTPEAQATTSGPPYPGIEHRIVDHKSGRDVTPGAPGEILLRGLVMRGYWDDPENTARTIDGDGWLHTGDLASVDDDGNITFRGRIKTMMKIGGENVAAEEVERVILEHPDVQDAVVVSVPDARRDEVPHAYVLAEPGADLDVVQLGAWCAERLARFKVPAAFVVLDELPRIGSGKADRTAIERLARDGQRTRTGEAS